MGFNPRSREGSDNDDPEQNPGDPGFNPRSREGSDDIQPEDERPAWQFQSTLPRRERLRHPLLFISDTACFNPRSREGSDKYLQENSLRVISSFNPRSREGSDYDIQELTDSYAVSIHAPAKGATP